MSSAQEFIDLLFFDLPDDEVAYTGTRWEHIPGLLSKPGLGRSNQALYTNLCTFGPPDGDEPLSRLDSNLRYLYAILLDDIGTKFPVPSLAPTCVIESSEGNYQYFYVLEEPMEIEDAKVFMQRMKSREVPLGDAGSFTVNRLCRLPCGVNGKEGSRFKVRVVPSAVVLPFFTPSQLISEWELPEPSTTALRTGGREPLLPADDYRRVRDPILAWLFDRSEVLGEESGGFVPIKCPWSDAHTDGDTLAGYSPVGVGGMPDFRAFHCFHEHCVDQKTADFLGWVREQGGPRSTVFDPVAPLVSRYVLLEYSQEVADTWAAANAVYPIVGLAAFKAAHKQFIRGERGAKSHYGDMWLESEDTVRCKGRVYEPAQDAIVNVEDVSYFNTYRPIRHDATAVGDVADYLGHLEWLIPDSGERAVFHSWVAQKLQQPRSRSFAVVMVADLAEGENGSRYGTGRSTVGDILGRVFQTGVAKLELGDIVGKGDSQSAYNDWADGTQLVVVEETKEEATSWRADHASYEKMKTVIDTRPIPDVRVKPKYGRIYTTTLFCNFLFFTNHSDALQLPADDRRFYVLDCARGRRTFAEYAGLRRFLESDASVAALYWWYMGLDISGFDHIYPPMTPAKQLMSVQARTTLDDVWDDALEALVGDICTKAQLLNACAHMAGDAGLESRIPGMVSARWKKMRTLSAESRLEFEGKRHRVRVVRNHESVRLSHQKRDFGVLCEMISQNKRFGV